MSEWSKTENRFKKKILQMWRVVVVVVVVTIYFQCIDGKYISPKYDDDNDGKDIVLYRLIGNDMPPLENKGQLLSNTMYALENERKDLPRTRKRWILNRIVDSTLHDQIMGILVLHGYESEDIIDIPFREEEMCAFRNGDDRVHYVANQNAARNMGYEHGLSDGFRWIFVFDGNGFVSDDQWNAILSAVDYAEKHNQRAMLVPMVRMNVPNDPSFLNASSSVESIMEAQPHFAEPQIGFRNDLLPSGSLPYNEDLKYGVMNKLDLLDLCGFLNTQKINDATAKRYGHYLNHQNCHCGNRQLLHASRELLAPDFMDPSSKNYDKNMNNRHALGLKKNLPLSKKCGLWVRLYPSPSDDAIQYVDDGGQNKKIPTTHCKSIGVKSLIDVIRCRASVRVEAKKKFRHDLYRICVRSGYSLNPKEMNHYNIH